MENGVVVFHDPVPLPDGTPVLVEAVSPGSAAFWENCSLEELARRQHVSPPLSDEEMLGGWPQDEIADGLEEAVKSWRELEKVQ
jgi:hypothetical protein